MIQEEALLGTKIQVFGVGGGGSNAVARMLNEGLTGVEFCVLNTDVQALAASPVPNKLAIGSKITNGLGAGSDPRVGRQAALEDTEKIIDLLEGADMVFVTAGLGGGTGTGAAPVVASLAKELGALTVAVVTKPFAFEGPKRRKQAEHGLAELASVVDTVITIPNDQLLRTGSQRHQLLRSVSRRRRRSAPGRAGHQRHHHHARPDQSRLLRHPHHHAGHGLRDDGHRVGQGRERGHRSRPGQAISCPLMEAGGVRGARGVLINITGSSRLGLHEVNEACTLIREAADNEDVQINFGVVLNEAMGDEVKITVIATGFERETLPHLLRKGEVMEPVHAMPGLPASVSIRPEPIDGIPKPVVMSRTPAQPVEEEAPIQDLDVPAFCGGIGGCISKGEQIQHRLKPVPRLSVIPTSGRPLERVRLSFRMAAATPAARYSRRICALAQRQRLLD